MDLGTAGENTGRSRGGAAWPSANGRLAPIAGLILALAVVVPPSSRANDAVLIFAAASLQTAFDALKPALERETGTAIRVSTAASSALARQIEAGAPAALFVSADEDWMDYLAARQLIRPDSRVTLVGNRLVLIAPAGQAPALVIGPGFPLRAALGAGRLAIADPATVPAGRYAKAALQALRVWDAVADRLAPAENVRAALGLVALGEAPLGIVYRTDAVAEPAVRLVDTFAEATHAPIRYPMALTHDASAAAARVWQALRGTTARATFAAQGFLVPE